MSNCPIHCNKQLLLLRQQPCETCGQNVWNGCLEEPTNTSTKASNAQVRQLFGRWIDQPFCDHCNQYLPDLVQSDQDWWHKIWGIDINIDWNENGGKPSYALGWSTRTSNNATSTTFCIATKNWQIWIWNLIILCIWWNEITSPPWMLSNTTDSFVMPPVHSLNAWKEFWDEVSLRGVKELQFKKQWLLLWC
jgi:hypothetical protein